MEIPLEEVPGHLEEILEDKYKKEKKVGGKLLQQIMDNLNSIQDSINDLASNINKERDDLKNRALTRFVDALQSELKKFDPVISEIITHKELKRSFDFLSKLFTVYNESAKKWARNFAKDFKGELKQLDSFMNSLFRKNGKLDHFIRNKYDKVREAEEITEKIDDLDDLCKRVVDEQTKIEQYKGDKEDIKKKLENMEKELLDLENDPLVAKRNKLFRDKNKLKQEITLEFSRIKKSMKKFQKAIDNGRVELRFVTKRDIKDYFKNPFQSVINDGPEYPTLRAILDNLEGSLGEEVKLKGSKKDKTQETISEMRDQYSLKPVIEKYLAVENERKQILEKIENKGTAEKIETIKQQISDLTTQKGHIETDTEHEKENVLNTLTKIKSVKKEIEDEINALTKREQITILVAI